MHFIRVFWLWLVKTEVGCNKTFISVAPPPKKLSTPCSYPRWLMTCYSARSWLLKMSISACYQYTSSLVYLDWPQANTYKYKASQSSQSQLDIHIFHSYNVDKYYTPNSSQDKPVTSSTSTYMKQITKIILLWLRTYMYFFFQFNIYFIGWGQCVFCNSLFLSFSWYQCLNGIRYFINHRFKHLNTQTLFLIL